MVGVLANGVFLLLLEIVVVSSAQLLRDRNRGELSLVPGISTVLTLALAVVIGIAVPLIGLWAMLLLFESTALTTRFVGGSHARASPLSRRGGTNRPGSSTKS